jgi:tRNA(fMet)-specific endonuclease VapC
MMIVLDTDHVSLLEWGGYASDKIHRRLESLGWDRPPTTIVTYEEQMRGWMDRVKKATTVSDQVAMYAKLSRHIKFFSTLELLDFSDIAAVEFQRLRGMKVRIGTMDLKIAAIAMANDATLWTRNLVHFTEVPGLRVEDAAA